MYRRGATISVDKFRSRLDQSRAPILQMVTSEETYAKGDGKIKINKDGHTYMFNIDSFRRKLQRLRKKADMHVSKLEEERSDLDEIVQIMSRLYHDPENYAKLMKEVKEIFGDVKNPLPESVAARFIGCFRENGNPAFENKGCDPTCASSLAPTDEVKNYAPCEDTVLIYENGSFLSLRDVNTEHVFISIKRGDQFTEENIRNLKNAGFLRVTLVVTNEDGQTRDLKGPIPIDNLQSSTTTETSTSNAWTIAFIIILILLILAIAAFIYYSMVYSR